MDSARAEYRAAKATVARSRARGLAPMGASADFHYKNEADYLRIGELAWDCYRNDEVVGQGVDRLIDLVFRDGLIPDPDTGVAELDALIKEDFSTWGGSRESCDISGESTLHGMARLAGRHRVVAGDMAVLLLESGQLQAVEGYRMRTPKNARGRKEPCIHGVVLDAYRRPKEYWFAKDDIGTETALTRVDEVNKYRAFDGDGHRQVLHVFDKNRVSQTRGVSAMVRLLETAAQLSDLQWATLVKAQANACFAILSEQEAKAGSPTSGVALGPRTTETGADGFIKTMEMLAPGMVYRGKPGEKLKGYAPNIPNAEFFDHSRLILMFIAINLGVPVEVLLLDSSQTNFSGWRGAMDIAKTGLRRFRQDMVDQFYKPIYEWRVRRLLASNERAAALAAGAADGDDTRAVNALRHEWKPPRDPYIEPLKDASADKMIVENGLDSARNVMGARGLEVSVVHRDLVHDNKHLILLALRAEREIRTEFEGWAGDWRDLLNPWRVNGGQAAPAGDEGEEEGTTTESTESTKSTKQKEEADA